MITKLLFHQNLILDYFKVVFSSVSNIHKVDRPNYFCTNDSNDKSRAPISGAA